MRDFVVFLSLSDGAVAVERNGDVVTRATHPTTSLVEGDVIEIVRFVGGGWENNPHSEGSSFIGLQTIVW